MYIFACLFLSPSRRSLFVHNIRGSARAHAVSWLVHCVSGAPSPVDSRYSEIFFRVPGESIISGSCPTVVSHLCFLYFFVICLEIPFYPSLFLALSVGRQEIVRPVRKLIVGVGVGADLKYRYRRVAFLCHCSGSQHCYFHHLFIDWL